jgi:hypothetical protein
MTAVTYTAERSLVTGRVQGTEVRLRLRCRQFELSKDSRKSQQRALGVGIETLLWRNSNGWQIETNGYNEDTGIDEVIEFLESVSGGETFTVDEFGDGQADDNPIDVVMLGDYDKNRIAPQGHGGRDDYYRFAFRVVRV